MAEAREPGRRRDPAAERAARRANLERQLAQVRKARLLSPVLALAIVVMGWFFVDEWWTHHDDARWPIADGTVQSVEKVRRTGVARPELTIRVDGSGEVVRARLFADGERDFGPRVRFHYGGDPVREVRLLGETSPLALLGVFVALGALLACIVPFAQRRLHRQLEALDAEECDVGAAPAVDQPRNSSVVRGARGSWRSSDSR